MTANSDSSLISFTPKQRFIGEAAKTAETSNFKNTVGSLTRMIGRTLEDPDVQSEEKKFINAKLVDVGGQVGAQVQYLGETTDFSYTQLVGAYLGKLRDTAAAELKQAVSDVVIAIPGWYTDVQRRAMIDAAKIAGLNPLRLINSNTAVALGYGITKADLPEDPENPRYVVFCDVGHATYSVSVVAYSKGQLVVKGTAHDRNFGGRDIDYALVQHFAKEFQTKYKIDVLSNPKAIFRLAAGCERLKKVLSANTEAPLNVENIMMDVDASSSMKREELEGLISHLLDRFDGPLEAALTQAGITKEQVHSIELVGGSTRIPAIKEKLSNFFGKQLSYTLNQDEAVARGATFACASLSPVFRVREFAVQDIINYPIKVQWQKEPGNPDEETELTVFPAKNALPSTKILTFYRKAPFELESEYVQEPPLPVGTKPHIGQFSVNGVKPTESGDLSCVKVKVRVNLNGIANFEQAYGVQEVEKEEVTVTGEGDDKKEETRIVKKLERTGDYPTSAQYNTWSEKVVNDWMEAEGKMHADDKLVQETEERKNALEEYVYDVRGKLDDRYKQYVTAEEKEKLLPALQAAEDWLYSEEGEDAPKSAYIKKTDELRAIGDKIVFRYRENDERPRAVRELREVINFFLSAAQNGEEKYAHISDEDKQKVIEKCATIQHWLEDQVARQSEKPKNVDPIFTSADLQKKKDDVQYSCASIMNRPKPKTSTETPSGTETPKEAPKEEPKQPEEDMDID